MQAAAPKPKTIRRAHPGQGVPMWRASKWPNQRSCVENGERGLGRDHLYSVAALTNAAGSVVERYRYDTYGNRTVLAPDGITTRAVSSYNQQVGFTGRYLDKETGLWFFRARYYSGSLGRFIQQDPKMYIDGRGLYGAYYVPNAVDPFGMDKTITVQFELNKGKWGKFIDAMRKAKSAVDGMRSLTSLFPFGIVPYARYWEGDMAFRGRLSVKYDEKTCKLLKVDALASVQADVNAEAGFSMEYGIEGGYIGLFGKAEAGGSVGAYWEKGSGAKGYGAANVAVTAGINGGVHATIVRVNVWGGLRASVQLRAETPPFKIIWDPSITGAMGVDIQRRRGFFDWTWSTVASMRIEGGDLLGEYGKPTDIWKAGKEYVDKLDDTLQQIERSLNTPLDRNGWSKDVLFSDE